MEKIVIEIDENGNIYGFADEIEMVFDEKELNIKEKKRVSHIIPKNILLRILFKTIRSLVNDKSKIAEWTRTWKCSWLVKIDNQYFGPFKDRKEAVKFEKEKIRLSKGYKLK